MLLNGRFGANAAPNTPSDSHLQPPPTHSPRRHGTSQRGIEAIELVVSCNELISQAQHLVGAVQQFRLVRVLSGACDREINGLAAIWRLWCKSGATWHQAKRCILQGFPPKDRGGGGGTPANRLVVCCRGPPSFTRCFSETLSVGCGFGGGLDQVLKLARPGWGNGASRPGAALNNIVSMFDEIEGFGPAMQALSEKQRRYVLAMLADPFGNPSRWAAAAGYSEVKGNNRVKGHIAAHNPMIEAAAAEVAKQHMGTMGPVLGVAVAMRIARNNAHPKQLRAAEMLLNRSGMHEKTEHVVKVSHSMNADDVVARIKAAAAKLGVDPAVLLGQNAAVPMKLIEGVSRETEQQDG